jgi:hypothetical protein
MVRGRAEKKKEKTEKQVLLLFFMLAFLFASSLAFVSYYRKKAYHFEHAGFSFEKISYDGMLLYKTTIRVETPHGITNRKIYFMNDPRGLDTDINCSLLMLRKLEVAFMPEVDRCAESGVAGYKLGSFLAALGIAAEGKRKVNCSVNTTANAANAIVFEATRAARERIFRRGSCIVIGVRNCNAVRAAETFMLETMKFLRERK